MADYADAVADLITALDLRRVHLCGLSFGGALALVVYRRHPQLVRSLVLASAYAGWKGSLPTAEVEARLARALGELDVPPAGGSTATCPASSPDRCRRRPSTSSARSCWRSDRPGRDRCWPCSPRPTCARFYRPSPCPPCCSTAQPTCVRRARSPKRCTRHPDLRARAAARGKPYVQPRGPRRSTPRYGDSSEPRREQRATRRLPDPTCRSVKPRLTSRNRTCVARLRSPAQLPPAGRPARRRPPCPSERVGLQSTVNPTLTCDGASDPSLQQADDVQ
jgi:pimeloyl-ACP methyl ester carboxylesterase